MTFKKAIIYIRVSTDEQANKGASLPYQQQRISDYCQLNKIKIDKIFQEDYSAKTFDRPAFNELLTYCRAHKKSIDQLLVLKWDRFSRNAPESYRMLQEFFKMDIQVNAIEQPLDLTVPENKLMLAFYLAAPEVENDRRSMNTIAGMKQKLLQGKWVTGSIPLGYMRDPITRDLIHDPVKAPLIRQAFQMILDGSMITDVGYFMKQHGINRPASSWAKTLRNQIYMGMIENKLLDHPVKAALDPIITEETFFRTQKILDNPYGSTVDPDVYALKSILLCPKCDKPLTGYAVGKKQYSYKKDYYIRKTKILYYKCNSKGCRVNLSLAKIHESFYKMLGQLTISTATAEVIRPIAIDYFKNIIQNEKDRYQAQQHRLTTLQNRMTSLNIKFIDGHLDTEVYNKIKADLFTEISDLEEVIQDQSKLSNPYDFVDLCLKLSTKTDQIWQQSSHQDKKILAGILFPEGIYYDKEKGHYRTPKLNQIYHTFSALGGWNQRKSHHQDDADDGLLHYGSPWCSEIEPLSVDDLIKIEKSIITLKY